MRSVQKQLHDKNVRPDAPACARVTRTDARLVCAGTRAVEPGGPGRFPRLLGETESHVSACAAAQCSQLAAPYSAASHLERLARRPRGRARCEWEDREPRLFATGQQGKAVPRRVAEPCKRATAWRYPLKPPPSVTPECVRSDRAWRCAELSWRAGRRGLGLARAVGHNGLDWTGPRTAYQPCVQSATGSVSLDQTRRSASSNLRVRSFAGGRLDQRGRRARVGSSHAPPPPRVCCRRLPPM
jgi:hypothetical protein